MTSAASNQTTFKERLVLLDCSYVLDLDEATIKEFLLSPGEERYNILQWLFLRCDSTGKIAEFLDPSKMSFGAKTESRIQKLYLAARALCVCGHNDVDLIRGGGPVQKQINFIDRLLDMACIRYQSDIGKHSSDPRSNPYLEQLNILVNQDWFMSMLCAKESFLPKDVLADVEKMWSQEGWEKGKSLPCPDVNDLSNSSKNLMKKIKKQNSKLSDLQEQVTVQGEDKNNEVQTNTQTLNSALRELRQLAEGFTQCYESNLSPWCHKPPLEHSELGNVLKRIHGHLHGMVQLLTDLHKIRDRQGKLTELSKHQPGVPAHVSGDSLKRCLSILEETIHRVSSNFSTKYKPVVML